MKTWAKIKLWVIRLAMIDAIAIVMFTVSGLLSHLLGGGA